MKAYKASLINGITLVIFGLWGSMNFICGSGSSWTPLIPVFLGIILLIFNGGVKKENKIIAHIVVLLTLLIGIALLKPLTGAIEKSDTGAIIRVVIMLGSTIFAMITFIQSFIQARRDK